MKKITFIALSILMFAACSNGTQTAPAPKADTTKTAKPVVVTPAPATTVVPVAAPVKKK